MSSLYSEVSGEGPPLVLLHGWGLNVRVWDTLLPALVRRFKVIAIDLPGHGRSPWHDAARTLEGYAELIASTCAPLVQESLTLLGWSLGGQIALQLVLTQSRTRALGIERLALIATTPKFAASPDWPHGMSEPVLAGFARQLATDYHQTVSDFLELQVRGSSNSAAVLDLLRSALFAHGEAQHAALTAGLDTLATTDLRAGLGSIRQPTLIVAGQYDRVTPPSAGRALAENLPNARYLEIRRAGHAPFLSHPEALIHALTDANP